MANQEQLDRLLKEGVQAWNEWREKNPDVQIKLFRANFREANFELAELGKGRFLDAQLDGADLHGADLRFSDLRGTKLHGAQLQDANLSNADLRGANLEGANFSNANFSNANLSEAILFDTVFGNNDLSSVKGLDTVRHYRPSTIGIDTIYASHGNIPEAFLKGAGVDDTFLTYIHSLVGKAIEYYSCFISYSNVSFG